MSDPINDKPNRPAQPDGGGPGPDCHPALADWFRDKFGEPTDIQRRAWGPITGGEHVLLAAPTGSGKTLAALLPCLNRIVQANRNDAQPPGVRLLYVTPLKALNNDIHEHLLGFLRELKPYGRRYEERTGERWSDIRTGVRTGDTTQSTRASMLRNPPDVLVTTPESLFLLLASAKARQMLRTVEQVIVDEIHDLAADKRGMHLSVTLERLERLCGRPLQRIGVSATMKPMERVARFLGGWTEAEAPLPDSDRGANSIGGRPSAGNRDESARQERKSDSAEWVPRPVTVIESGMAKTFDVSVTLHEVAMVKGNRAEPWTEMAKRLFGLMEGCRSVIVFVNNRRLCERLTLHLNDVAGFETARSHHGSVSRERRLETERTFKEGGLRCIVATSSLELGIDVGHVDLVIQIDSPQSAASGIQRIGRAGHSVGDVSRGIIVARHRGQLAECAVLAKEIAERRIEEIRIPEGTIDVFNQQAIAMAAAEEWTVDGLIALVRRSDSFRGMNRERMIESLRLLAGYYPHCRPLIEWDREAGTLRGLRAANAAVLTGAGTIPQSSAYPVYHAETRVHIGELDEEYVHETRTGDVFQLGTASYRVASIKGDRIYAIPVEANAFSEIPFWRGEGAGRSYELSLKVGALLRRLEETAGTVAEAEAIGWLMAEYRMDDRAAEALVALVASQKAACALPSDRKIVIEHYADDAKRRHIVVHALFGRKTNRTWMLALQRWFEAHTQSKLYAFVRDNEMEFIFHEWEPAFADFWTQVNEHNVEELLAEAIPSSALFGITFRHLAQTSLLLDRGFARIPLWKQRLRSEQLLERSLPYADRFPLIREAMRVCLHDSLDPKRVREMLGAIRRGEIAVDIRRSEYPSPFAAQFSWDYVNVAMYETDAVPRDIQYRLLSVSKRLAGQFFEPSAFQELMDVEEAQSWIDAGFEYRPGFGEAVGAEEEGGAAGAGEAEEADRDGNLRLRPDERLQRLLKRQGDLSAAEIRSRLGDAAQAEAAMAEMKARGAVVETEVGGERRWICADEVDTYAAFPQDDHAASFVLRRFVDRQIAFSADTLVERYWLGREQAEEWIRRWEEDGTIERSPFARSPDEPLWTSRSAASRLLRFSLGQLRRRSEPVPQERYCRLLFELQHVAPDSRLEGIDGLRQAIGQLQGIYLPLSHWESIVLPARVADYRKEWLDLLCAGGEAIWVGRKEEGEKEGRVAFYLTDPQGIAVPAPEDGGNTSEPELLELLRSRGASFLTALSRDTGLPPSELLEKLLKLVWEGRVSNDQFAPIRLHGTTAGVRTSRRGFQSGLGRWYLVSEAAGASGAFRPHGFAASAPAPVLSPASGPTHASGSAAAFALPTMTGGGLGESEKTIVAWIHHVLKSYGVVTRDGLNRLVPADPARVQETVRKLEDWGMVVRGFWIEGIPYMQLSTTDVVEKMRHMSDAASEGTLVLSSVDPANPYGTLLKWPERSGASFARKPGNYLVFHNGRWVLWIENNGRRFVTVEREKLRGEEAENVVLESVRAMMRLAGLRKIVVDSWDGAAAPKAEAAVAFRRIGAETDRDAFVLWPSSLRDR
jgi:ATP-dependent Lhr-like helicase